MSLEASDECCTCAVGAFVSSADKKPVRIAGASFAKPCNPKMNGAMRVMPSDPAYQEINRLADWIAKLKNPQLFWDLKDMPELERLVNIADLESLFEELSH